jgi:hypothetical protein
MVTPFATYGPWYVQRLGWHILLLRPLSKLPFAGCDRCRRPTETRPNPLYVRHEWSECPCLQTPGALCHGLWAATNDPAVVDQWAEQYPDANLAVHLGRSNKLVVDLDDHGGECPEQPLPGIDAPCELVEQVKTGLDTFSLLCNLRGQDWPITLTQETPSGGAQMMFDVGDGSRFKPSASMAGLGWQIDIKGGPSYAVLPGSVTEKGEYKVVNRCDPAPVPSWLAADLTRTGHVREVREQPQRDPNWHPPRLSGGKAYVEKAVADELDAVAHCTSGRNEQLVRSAFALGQFVGSGLLNRDAVHAALTDAAATAGISPNEAKAQDTIRRGLDAGARQPRTIPEGGRRS